MTGLADVRRLLRSREGATAIEFALVALPYLTLILGVIEFSRVVWTHSAMQYAVERAARYASMNASGCETYAASQMLAPGVLATNFSCNVPTCDGHGVFATTSLTLLLPYSLTLTAQSCHPHRG